MLMRTNTPLAETLYDGMRYLKGELPSGKLDSGVSRDSPVILECQKTFIVFLTDGEPCGEKDTMVHL
jgi:hypothetical protein